jgi:hypothetical protein
LHRTVCCVDSRITIDRCSHGNLAENLHHSSRPPPDGPPSGVIDIGMWTADLAECRMVDHPEQSAADGLRALDIADRTGSTRIVKALAPAAVALRPSRNSAVVDDFLTRYRARVMGGMPVSTSPFGHRHSLLGSSCSRRGVGPSSRSAYHPPAAGGPRRGFHVPHSRDSTGVGALSTPGTSGALLTECRARPAPAATKAARPNTPPETSHRAEPLFTEHQRRFTPFTRPVCPSPVTSTTGRRSFGFPPGFAPRRYQRRTPRKGPGSEHAPGTTPPTSRRSSKLRVHSQKCDPRVATACECGGLDLRRSAPDYFSGEIGTAQSA